MLSTFYLRPFENFFPYHKLSNERPGRGLRCSVTMYYAIGWRPTSIDRLFNNDYNLPQADDAEATCQCTSKSTNNSAILRFFGLRESLSYSYSPKHIFMNPMTTWIGFSPALVTESVSGNQTDGQRRPWTVAIQVAFVRLISKWAYRNQVHNCWQNFSCWLRCTSS